MVEPAAEVVVTVEDLFDEVIVKVSGELDVFTAAVLREALMQIDLDGGISLRMDLAELRFLDSTGVGTLVSTAKRVRASGGKLSTICPAGAVSQVLETTGLVEYLGMGSITATA